MIVQFPRLSTVKEGDLIAVTKNNRFIGYGQVVYILDSCVLVDIDRNASKTFNELYGEAIPYSISLD